MASTIEEFVVHEGGQATENTAQRAIDYVWLSQRKFREQESFEMDPKG